MKKAILIISLSLLTSILFAQINLVTNGDFEIYSSLPTDYGQSNFAIGWNNVNAHYPFVQGYGSPDYDYVGNFIAFGAMIPISGSAQMGLVTYQDWGLFREYISSQLAISMISGHKYTISFYLTNGIDTAYTKGSNNFGIHFSNNPLYQATEENIPVTPQIEIDSIIYIWNYWQYFSFNYTADSSYKYITIGNFKDDTHTLLSTTGENGAYYFIDNIEIYPFKLKITGDSIICKGDISTLKTTADSIVKWANALYPDSIISKSIVLKVNPDITTTYLAYGNNNDTALFTVHVVNSPLINLGKDDTLCQGKLLILNATTPYATYIWQDSSAKSTYNVSKEGIYWVKVSINNNCFTSDTINISYINCDTIDNLIYIYPNPATNNLTIETNFNEEQRLEIINILGQTIYTTHIGRKVIINTSNYASGLYILKIYTDKEIVIRKFVKE